jgi:hypothetical protein
VIQCCVPFCERSTKATGEFTQWVCPEHWKGLPRQRRLAYNRAKKRWKESRSAEDQLVMDRMWARMKMAAINRALGLREDT